MKQTKKLILTLVVLIVLVFALCACVPDKVREDYIAIPNGDRIPFIVGKYKIVGRKQVNSYKQTYEVKLGEQEGLLELFRKVRYFVGEFELNESLAFESYTQGMYIGQIAIWLANEGDLWVCQASGEKWVNILLIDFQYIRNEDNTLIAKISEAFYEAGVNKFSFNTQYKTPFSWDLIKKIYSPYKVNEEEKSVLIDCEDATDGFLNAKKAQTKLYFNEADNTFWVSDNYTLVESNLGSGEK